MSSNVYLYRDAPHNTLSSEIEETVENIFVTVGFQISIFVKFPEFDEYDE